MAATRKIKKTTTRARKGRPHPAAALAEPVLDAAPLPADPDIDEELAKPKSEGESFPIVGIGASAGGIEAFEAFFRGMPAENGMGFVVLAHLDPSRDSMLPELLARWTEMAVVQAHDDDQ